MSHYTQSLREKYTTASPAVFPNWCTQSFILGKMKAILPDITSRTTTKKLADIILLRLSDRFHAGQLNEEVLEVAVDDELRKYVHRVEPTVSHRLSIANIASVLGVPIPETIMQETHLHSKLGGKFVELLRGHPDFALETLIPVQAVQELRADLFEAIAHVAASISDAPTFADGRWRQPKHIPYEEVQRAIASVQESRHIKTIVPENVLGYLYRNNERNISKDRLCDVALFLLDSANGGKSAPLDKPGLVLRMRKKKGATDGG